MSGEIHLIKLAYESRSLLLLIPCSETDDTGNLLILLDDVSSKPPRGLLLCILYCVFHNLIYPSFLKGETLTSVSIKAPLQSIVNSPGDFLTMNYLNLAKLNIKGIFNIDPDTVSDPMRSRANTFGILLHGKLEDHIRYKIPNVLNKHSHPCLHFVRENINKMAALLSFYNPTIKDPFWASKNACLLKLPSNASFVKAIDDQLEGCYLYNYTKTLEWVHSRKDVGSASSNPVAGLVKRNEEHRKRAAKATIM